MYENHIFIDSDVRDPKRCKPSRTLLAAVTNSCLISVKAIIQIMSDCFFSILNAALDWNESYLIWSNNNDTVFRIDSSISSIISNDNYRFHHTKIMNVKMS